LVYIISKIKKSFLQKYRNQKSFLQKYKNNESSNEQEFLQNQFLERRITMKFLFKKNFGKEENNNE
jgi:hypothetical protein